MFKPERMLWTKMKASLETSVAKERRQSGEQRKKNRRLVGAKPLSLADVLYPAFQLGLFLVLLKGIGALLRADSESCNLAISNRLLSCEYRLKRGLFS